MQEQNYKNHSRLVPLYHYVTWLLWLLAFIASIIKVVRNIKGCFATSLLFLGLTVIIGLAVYYARVFALKAQDRTIRAEENLRHFVLTGKQLPSALIVSQIIALRFASDDEWLALMQKALNEKMSSKQIKENIKNWRGDYYRV